MRLRGPVCQASEVGCNLEVGYSEGGWPRLDMGYRVDMEAQVKGTDPT